jgi:hypothetical protein
VQTQEPKMKVSPRLKAMVGLMQIEVVEFGEIPYLAHQLSVF